MSKKKLKLRLSCVPKTDDTLLNQAKLILSGLVMYCDLPIMNHNVIVKWLHKNKSKV